VRRRAVGTRDRIIAHLAAIVEIADPAGMASTRLAEAVGYPGSSVAFAQLLSGMERDGLIAREVRGKRTYRITLAAGSGNARRPVTSIGAVGLAEAARAAASASTAGVGGTGGGNPQVYFPAGIDYDELARRLLVQVLRRINAAPAEQQEALAGLMAENSKLRQEVSELRQALSDSADEPVSDELTALTPSSYETARQP
jgi:hypothetical protein